MRAARREARLTAAVLALVASSFACGTSHTFVSSNTEQGPPPFVGPVFKDETADAPLPRAAATAKAAPAAPAAPLTFYKASDSDDWVNRTFAIQAKYKRVIVVTPAAKAPATVSVPLLALNLRTAVPSVELPVDASVATLQDAADLAQGGDLVVVMPGVYQGFTLGDKADAHDNAYIRFVAAGAPGEVVIDRASGTDHNWMVIFQAAHHVVFEGFNIAGTSPPGKTPGGPNAGIFIDGDFAKSSKMAHHIAIVRNFSHDHRKWGLHAVDSHTVLMQDNVFANSSTEHAAYISDGSDDYVIRRNVFMSSTASGLQCNVDPLASLEKLRDHPALQQDQPPYKQTREWALAILKMATDRFGANNFPDGRGFNYIIEDNVITGTGKVGGAAINLAGVRESVIQNNLIYAVAASGIVEWDNGNPFDSSYVSPGPRSPADVTGPESLPMFGCFSNVVRNNTVVMNVRSRPALLVGSGSWGTRVRNNVLVNDLPSSVEIHTTGIWRFDSAQNVLNNVTFEGSAGGFKSLALSLPERSSDITGITRARLAIHFVQPSEEPWVLFDKGWWKPNPRRPDFHPVKGSTLLSGTGDRKEMPKTDLTGTRRGTADIGAFAAMN